MPTERSEGGLRGAITTRGENGKGSVSLRGKDGADRRFVTAYSITLRDTRVSVSVGLFIASHFSPDRGLAKADYLPPHKFCNDS